jgi:drug/metabolite transporter (DMT)-like permease
VPQKTVAGEAETRCRNKFLAMLGAFLTTLFFSFSSIAANRSIRSVGMVRANFGRLVVALVCLGTWALLMPLLGRPGWGGSGFRGPGLLLMVLSGVCGIGLGDLAWFAALPRLGSRLTVVMTQCLAAPIAACLEWLWIGTHLTLLQIGWGLVILGGVAFALIPSKTAPARVPVTPLGVLFGVLSAFGQGSGAVLSRKAYGLIAAAGEHLDGITATYQRLIGGAIITVIFFTLRSVTDRHRSADGGAARPGLRRWGWTVANGLSGAVFGISCYQWALGTTPSGIVLPIVATTPLIVVPLSYWIDGERPTRRSLLGGVIAVFGAVALARVR